MDTQVIVLLVPKTEKTAPMNGVELRENALQELGKQVTALEQAQKESHGDR